MTQLKYETVFKAEINGKYGVHVQIAGHEVEDSDVREDITSAGRNIVGLLMKDIELSDDFEARKQQHNDELLDAFVFSGLLVGKVTEKPNEYWGSDPYALARPWLEISTLLGKITVGWRKRVIVLDWSDCEDIAHAFVLFPEAADDNVTMQGKMIHCWGYDKLREYCKKLALYQPQYVQDLTRDADADTREDTVTD